MAKLSDVQIPGFKPFISGSPLDTSKVINKFTVTNAYDNDYQDQLDKDKYFGEEFDYTSSLRRRKLPAEGMAPASNRGAFVDTAMNIADFTGNFIGGVADAALLGMPTLIADLTGARWIREFITLGAYDTWEEEGQAGKWGRGLGEGLGMLVPFGWAGKALNYGGRALTNSTRWGKGLYTNLTDEAMSAFTKTYQTQSGGQDIISAINRIGGAKTGDMLDASTDAYRQGFGSVFKEAWELVHSQAYDEILKGSQKVLRQGVDDLSDGILKLAPKLDPNASKDLASTLIQQASFQSQNTLHRMTTHVAGKAFQNDYAKGVLGAYLSDFAVGSTMFLAESALHNLTVGAVASLGGDTMEAVKGRIDPRSKAAHTTESGSIFHVLGKTLQSGAWMGLIGPTRFV